MKVRFAEDALADRASWLILDRIVDILFEERHIWDVDDPDAIEQSPWIASEPGSRTTQQSLETLRRHVVAAQYAVESRAHSQAVTVCLRDGPPTSLVPADARRLLETPVYVVVEDAESDGTFLHAMIRTFERGILLAAFEKGWCEIRHGGGSSVPQRVEELAARAPRGPRRILVLSDSDRLKPDDPSKPEEKSEKVTIIETCRDTHSVSIAILRKREIENYLPVGALQRVPRRKQATYRSFLELDQRQRDYFDMKDGFKKDEQGRPVIEPEQVVLFRHLQPRARRALVGGFGKNVYKYFADAADVITRDAVRLTCPDDPQEIERILDTIEGLL